MNRDIHAAVSTGVPLWKVGVEPGISEPKFYRRIRTELPEEKAVVPVAIEKLSKEVE